jgi:hypothetical protein
MLEKHDLSVSLVRANVVVLFIAVPLIIVQLAGFLLLHPLRQLSITWNWLVFFLVVVAGIGIHELIHALTWMVVGRKPRSTIRLGIQWKTMTPYAHLTEALEVNAYRAGALMPGLLLGILPYLLSLALGDGSLLWFSILHTTSAGGDWLILWLLRKVKGGMLVEDHPTQAGCYVIGE